MQAAAVRSRRRPLRYYGANATSELNGPPYIGGMNEKGNRYAIAALKNRRATMAGEIVQMKEGITYREEQLSHLDAVLRELDPSYRSDTLPPKRLRRVKLFGNGELNRLIADALRRAEKPLASSDAMRLSRPRATGGNRSMP